MEALRDLDDVVREIEARIETLRRLVAAFPKPPHPRPHQSDAWLRRSIARLRSGAIVPANPAADRETLAAAMEQELEYRERVRELSRELKDFHEMLSADIEARKGEMLEEALTVFHAARHLPEAADPDSEVSGLIRTMERARREGFGQRRKK